MVFGRERTAAGRSAPRARAIAPSCPTDRRRGESLNPSSSRPELPTAARSICIPNVIWQAVRPTGEGLREEEIRYAGCCAGTRVFAGAGRAARGRLGVAADRCGARARRRRNVWRRRRRRRRPRRQSLPVRSDRTSRSSPPVVYADRSQRFRVISESLSPAFPPSRRVPRILSDLVPSRSVIYPFVCVRRRSEFLGYMSFAVRNVVKKVSVLGTQRTCNARTAPLPDTGHNTNVIRHHHHHHDRDNGDHRRSRRNCHC